MRPHTKLIAEALGYPLPHSTVAKTFGITRQRVQQIANQIGLHGRTPKPWQPKKELPELWEKFIKNVYQTHSCWFWIGGGSKKSGYGTIRIGYSKYVHRVSPYLFSGREIPNGMDVIHTCDTPQCVNPQHLIFGTAKQNTQDGLRKGHYNGPRKYLKWYSA